MSLLVMGTVALDDIKAPSGYKKDLLGGSASHFCMSARLFTKVHLAGVVGKDFPKKYIKFLKDKGVDITSLVRSDGKTFHWNGEYKKEDFNTALTLATEIGVLQNYVPQITEQQKKIPNVFLANIDPGTQLSLLKKMNKPKLVGLDSMNLWITHQKPALVKLMKHVDIFVVNDGEARMLTGEDNLIRAARMMRRMGPSLIVVKKGEHGVLFDSEKYQFAFSAYPVDQVVDPTGAGDTFAGGLMGYLSRGKKINQTTLKEAVLYGQTISSFNVQGFAMSRTSRLTLAQVNKRKKELVKFISV